MAPNMAPDQGFEVSPQETVPQRLFNMPSAPPSTAPASAITIVIITGFIPGPPCRCALLCLAFCRVQRLQNPAGTPDKPDPWQSERLRLRVPLKTAGAPQSPASASALSPLVPRRPAGPDSSLLSLLRLGAGSFGCAMSSPKIAPNIAPDQGFEVNPQPPRRRLPSMPSAPPSRAPPSANRTDKIDSFIGSHAKCLLSICRVGVLNLAIFRGGEPIAR